MVSLSGTVFSGKSSIGIGGVGSFFDWFDDAFLPDSSHVVSTAKPKGTQEGFIACGPGYVAQYSPTTNSSKCVPEDPNVKVYVDGKPVDPNSGKDGCSPGTEFVRRSDGTGTCVATAKVTTVSQTWGKQTIVAGGDTYNQKGSTVCPKGTEWDPVEGQCGKGTCPPGTVLDPINGTCDKVAPKGSSGGSGAPRAPSGEQTTPPPSTSEDWFGLSPMAIAAIVLGVGAMGAVVYKVRKDRKQKKMEANFYEEVEW